MCKREHRHCRRLEAEPNKEREGVSEGGRKRERGEREGERRGREGGGVGGEKRETAAYKTSGLQYIIICISSALWETFNIIG